VAVIKISKHMQIIESWTIREYIIYMLIQEFQHQLPELSILVITKSFNGAQIYSPQKHDYRRTFMSK